MWPNQQDFSAIPVSQGKLKGLWDAVRQAGVTPNGGSLPLHPDGGGADGDPSAPSAPVGPANPLPPKPIPQAGPPSIDTPAGPVAAPPPSTLPADSRVQDLQGQVDASRKKPSLLQNIGRALPSLLVSGIGAAFGQGGAGFQGTVAGQTKGIEERDKQRAALVQELDSATHSRSEEYSAQQRAQELSNAARIAAGSRETVASTNAGAKTDVADTNAGAKRDVATSTNQNRLDVQDKRNQGSYATAIVGANGRIQSAKYTADAAANRQTRSIDAAAARQRTGIEATGGRQQASFEHSDDKPTADEDRRADLSKSLDTLADRLTDISTRRPELFGPIAGRLTKGKMAVGTSDPDVAELKSIQENLGQISLGAHAMRNAGHIATAADSMANIYNSPEAYRAGLVAGKGSADTMQTITRPRLLRPTSGPKSTSRPIVKPKDNDPLGIR